MGTISSGRTASRRRVLKLQCPECTHDVRVARDELLEGVAVQCQHCGSEAELAREFHEAAGTSQWVLIDPLVGYDEPEPRRN